MMMTKTKTKKKKKRARPGAPRPNFIEMADGGLRLNLHPGQTLTWESRKRFVFMLAGTQGGKAIAAATPIPTPTGFTPMGDLVVGDTVLDENGAPCTVTLATPLMYGHDCYRVVFTDGASLIADADHLWAIVAPIDAVKTTTQLARMRAAPNYPAIKIPAVNGCPRTLFEIYPVHSVPVRCIQVDSPSRLYLAGQDRIVTHNTSFGPWWLHREIYSPTIGRGSGDYIVATSTFDLFKLKLLPEVLSVFEGKLGVGRYWSGDRLIELKDPETGQFWAKRSSDPMWGRIILRSASAEGGLESTTAKAAWLDEVGQVDFSLEAWEAVLRRVSLNQGRILGTTTLYTVGWLKQQVYDPWNAGDPDIDVIQFASYMNPLFSKDEYDRAKRTMPLWKFLMFYEGKFAKPPGLIYRDYIDDIGAGHLRKRFPIPAHWPRFVGVDPGGVNLATLWIAKDPARNIYFIYRTSLDGEKTTSEHVADNLQMAAGENVVLWAGGASSEGQFRRDWTNAGIHVIEPTVSDVEAGIDRVISLFKTWRLYVFDDLSALRNELATYSRELDRVTQEPTPVIKDKNKFHLLDAARYVVSHLSLYDGEEIDPTSVVSENPFAFLQPPDVAGPRTKPTPTARKEKQGDPTW